MAQATTSAGAGALGKLLHADADKLQFLSGLSAADQDQLATDVKAAHAAHNAHIQQKMEEALSHLPWLIRGPIRKLFGV